jgi:hypothetical protein
MKQLTEDKIYLKVILVKNEKRLACYFKITKAKNNFIRTCYQHF